MNKHLLHFLLKVMLIELWCTLWASPLAHLTITEHLLPLLQATFVGDFTIYKPTSQKLIQVTMPQLPHFHPHCKKSQ